MMLKKEKKLLEEEQGWRKIIEFFKMGTLLWACLFRRFMRILVQNNSKNFKCRSIKQNLKCRTLTSIQNAQIHQAKISFSCRLEFRILTANTVFKMLRQQYATSCYKSLTSVVPSLKCLEPSSLMLASIGLHYTPLARFHFHTPDLVFIESISLFRNTDTDIGCYGFLDCFFLASISKFHSQKRHK